MESSPWAGTQGCWRLRLLCGRHTFAVSKPCCRKGSSIVLGHSSGCLKVCAENHLCRRKSYHPYLGLWTLSCQVATSLSRAGFGGSCGRSLSLFRQQGINCLWQVSLKDRKTTKEYSLCLLARERITSWSLGALFQLLSWDYNQSLLFIHRDIWDLQSCALDLSHHNCTSQEIRSVTGTEVYRQISGIRLLITYCLKVSLKCNV